MSDVITCNQYFDGDNLHGPRRITYSDGVVTSIVSFDGTADYEVVSPGFVDIQMNGFEQWDVARGTTQDLFDLGVRLKELGTTSWLGTITTASLENLAKSITSVSDAMGAKQIPGCVGIHVEGPFLGQAPGAHNPSLIIPVDGDWIRHLPSTVRLMTIAAEQDEISDGISLLRSKNICVSIGHSRPTLVQWQKCRDAGARMVTHLFNGMSGIHHREDGLALLALIDSEVYVGLIGDLVHVSPLAVSLAFTVKGQNRLCLVSDSVAWSSEWAKKRGIQISDGSPRLPDGTLAGSSIPIAECVRRVVAVAGIPLEQALRAATSAPSDAVGLVDMGRIVEGQPADLVALDSSLYVSRTWSRLVSLRG